MPVTIKRHVGEENIATTIIETQSTAFPYAVVVVDEDAKALITRINCRNIEMAEQHFARYAK